jgi:molybdopterin synthase sulfur carrier subunit
LRLFGPAREAAGIGSEHFDAASVAELLDAARARYPPQFSVLLKSCRVWVNGDDAGPDRQLLDGDEVAIIPPISGG